MEDNLDDSSNVDIKVPRKRKRRAVLSCNDCRRRKLKCDRELPCNRCIQGSVADKCAYGLEEGSVHSSEAPPSKTKGRVHQERLPGENLIAFKATETPHQNRIEQLQDRIASLEALLKSRPAAPKESAAGESNSTEEEKEVPYVSSNLVGLFKGRDYRTFSYGPTSPVTIVVNFPELRPFMKSIYPDSTLERLTSDIKVLEDRARKGGATSRVLSVRSLRELLPDRITVDVLVNRYIESFETTYRILHIPTFWAEYQRFWDQPEYKSGLEAVLLGILACVLCTSTHDSTKYDPNGSTFRSKAIIWIKACEAWLKRQSNKHRTLAVLQVRLLRLLALKTTCLKTKEFYQEVQAHFGFMKGIGMHRDPAAIGVRCTPFEGEIRRRLWWTSVDLEIQSSVDRGISSALSGLDHDCAAPRNIDDAQLFVDIQDLPPSKPMSVYTDSSFITLSAQTAALRARLCTSTNSIRGGMGFEEILQYEQELQTALDRLPKWTDARALHAWTHLDLQLRQFFVILHTPRAFQTQQRAQPNHRYSLLTCLESSSTLIERHNNLLDSGNFSLCCIRSDYYRAALVICHIAYHASRASDNFILRVARSLFDEAMERSLRLQEERSMRPGRGNHQFWYVSAAISLVRTQFDPSRADILKRQAGDRVAKLLYKILALQDDSSEEYLANEVVLVDEPNVITTRGNLDLATSSATLPDTFADGGMRLDGFDLGNTSEWMLDDFWFLNDFQPLPFGN
ncbi:hypothetical protein BDV96DRAFT_606350 [Lophiotrema nucula]|uniref:Zn(2)-C6 fungal-type domain-containing protein n=1 Tax=Lophiotrema nucula TaxID=690887 RepID=A0A6A5YME9_9PLEO|nr:hypothetical protein BDV96DRAFT_606350 [Lophiotrema nucula]